MHIFRKIIHFSTFCILSTHTYASDSLIVPEPDDFEYLRVCNVYGAGYFYMPGTRTCLGISGYVRYTAQGGTDAYSGRRDGGWEDQSRFDLVLQSATKTELGDLKTYVEVQFNWDGSKDKNTYEISAESNGDEYAYITLGGLVAGYAPTAFTKYISLGNVINDGVISQGEFTPTGQISYTYTKQNGFSGVVAVEQGNGKYILDSYMPYVVGSFQNVQGWGSIAASAVYDSVVMGWAGQLNTIVKISEELSLWAVTGYSNKETNDQGYGAWGGKWAVWGGAAYQLTEKASLNIQGATEQWGMVSVTANMIFKPNEIFEITPEVTWTRFKDDGHYDYEKRNAVQALLRFQRNF